MLGGHGKADDSSGCAESEFGSFAAWADSWAAADELVSAAVDELLDQTGLSGLAVAREVVAAIPSNSLLVLGASQPIRDAELVAAPRPDLSVIANRGLAGIDGTVSTAMGAALAYQAVGDALPGGSPAVGGPAYALLGDLTFLHDGNGLLLGPEEPRPDLTIVVVNNDGGGIFGLLEQGGAGSTAVFERVFATPHGADLRAWCAATGTRYSRCEFPGELPAALAYEPGIRVVEVRTDRQSDRELHEQLRSTVTAALS
jgi:2-succinyl-5-enolpyruvyl-6-hydroxy-3-cyclohexene-1-carboxylate synthase